MPKTGHVHVAPTDRGWRVDVEGQGRANGTHETQQHLRLAWRELREHERDVALSRIETAIRRVAEAHGAPQKCHRTITEAWAAFVAYHLAEAPALTFDEFLEAFPGLLDGGLLKRHFSSELLATPAARSTWVDPDLRPLPAHT